MHSQMYHNIKAIISDKDPEQKVRLIAISKGRSSANIRDIYALGQEWFGENYVQELKTKAKELKDLDIKWSFCGRLQSNKLKDIVSICDEIQALSEFRHSQKISEYANTFHKAPFPVFIAVNPEGEASKGGLSCVEALALKDQILEQQLSLSIQGIFVIPEKDLPKDSPLYAQMAVFAKHFGLGKLSMGMSQDYETAIEQGSQVVRIGRSIFAQDSQNLPLIEKDQSLIWHPLTQAKTAPPNIPIQKAKGAYLYDYDGKAYLDLISSWWVNLHGHSHPEMAQALKDQAMELEHVIFAGFTHSPALNLCEELSKLLPSRLKRFFFSDNGSTAVEVAAKMAYQYWYNQGQEQRNLFLSFEGGYHGDTFGAMALGRESGFHDVYQHFFFPTLTLPYPHTWPDDLETEQKEHHSLKILDQYLDTKGSHICALIVEPLVQGSSGMRMVRPEFLQQVVDRVRSYGILVIFDEVMTGFYRTGTLFALEQVKRVPDFLCLSKGLTGGFLPLALTVTTEKIYEAFFDEHWKKCFTHSHSYTANPLACQMGVTSLNILNRPKTQGTINSIISSHQKALVLAQAYPVTKARTLGTIFAFDTPKAQGLKSVFRERGFLLRPLGDTLYLLPPYCITQEELELVYNELFGLLNFSL